MANQKTIFSVEGMTCSSCVARVENSVKNLPHILSATANLVNDTLTIESDELIENGMIIHEIEKSGYAAKFQKLSSNDLSNQLKIQEEKLVKSKKKFLLSLFLSLPVILISMLMMIDSIANRLIGYMLPINMAFTILTIAVMGIPGKEFFIKGGKNLLKMQFDMNSLVAVSTLASLIFSVYTAFYDIIHHQHYSYFETSVSIITLILLGKYLETKSKHKTSTSIEKLNKLRPQTALIHENGNQISIPINQIKVGAIIIIKPGDIFPCDGIVVSGKSNVDEKMVTGEAKPVEKTIKSNIIAGTQNINGSLEFEATNIGEDTLVSKIIKMVIEGQGSKAQIQNKVDKISSIFVPILILVSILTFVGHYFIFNSGFNTSLIDSISVLVVACPCALGIATPIAIITGVGLASEYGILFKNAEVIDQFSKVKHIAFDKTGTLTKGEFTIQKIINLSELKDLEIIKYAASMESKSSHPIAETIVKYAKLRLLQLVEIKDFNYSEGLGISAKYNEMELVMGNINFLDLKKISYNEIEINQLINMKEYAQFSPIFLAIGNKLSAIILIGDSIKAESQELLSKLKGQNISFSLISGDNKIVTQNIANTLSITKYYGNVLPTQKADLIIELKSENGLTAMVGDGINDAAALANSDIGISFAEGSDIAIETSDIVILNRNLNSIFTAYQISKSINITIYIGLFWAFFYNVLLIPLAIMGYLHPIFAAGAMALSSVSVISNALLLKRKRY